jgi:RNA polymerase sigma-70 factor (ECF subfamily)
LVVGESIMGGSVEVRGQAPLDTEELRAALSDTGGAVRRFLFGMCGDWHVAEDLAQESLLKAWRSRASFNGRANVRTWVFAIARNAWIDYLRRQRVRGVEETMDQAIATASTAPGPVASASGREFSAQMALAMTSLPPEQREALAMRESDGLTFIEIARLLDLPVATVKSRVRYALTKLANELRAFAPEQAS